MARKIVTPTTPTTTPNTGTVVATIAPVAGNWAYPAQAPTGSKGRGIGAGSVGAALLACLANGPVTLAAAQAAVAAQAASKGLRGTHPVQPLCRFIAVNGGVGLGFALAGGMLSMHKYQAPAPAAG